MLIEGIRKPEIHVNKKFYKSRVEFLIVFSFLVFSSCSSLDYSGMYISNDNQHKKLFISKNNFTLVEQYDVEANIDYLCCDTLAFGDVKYERGFLSFSSTENVNSNILYSNFQEIEEEKEDSLTIIILNPIENYYSKNNVKKDISYEINTISNDAFIDSWFSVNEFTTNKIVFKKNKDFQIEKIYLKIKIDCSNSLNQNGTVSVDIFPYKPSNLKANKIIISIPDLNFQYFAYKRLKNDYIKILNNNILLWDNEQYTRYNN